MTLKYVIPNCEKKKRWNNISNCAPPKIYRYYFVAFNFCNNRVRELCKKLFVPTKSWCSYNLFMLVHSNAIKSYPNESIISIKGHKEKKQVTHQ